jgi:hypothetical protein
VLHPKCSMRVSDTCKTPCLPRIVWLMMTSSTPPQITHCASPVPPGLLPACTAAVWRAWVVPHCCCWLPSASGLTQRLWATPLTAADGSRWPAGGGGGGGGGG